ncbi:hypothetical protein YC2023_049449 [Brassica napus]
MEDKLKHRTCNETKLNRSKLEGGIAQTDKRPKLQYSRRQNNLSSYIFNQKGVDNRVTGTANKKHNRREDPDQILKIWLKSSSGLFWVFSDPNSQVKSRELLLHLTVISSSGVVGMYRENC